MATPFMNLDLPVVSVTLGPIWAEKQNAALELIDSHDHSDGNGARITPAGMNINTTLDFNSNLAINLYAAKMINNPSTLTGSTYAGSVNVVNGNLYYTNSSGTAVQITSGSSIVTAPASVDAFQYDLVNNDLVIASGDTYVTINVDTTAARQITLPSASAVSVGRIYIIKDNDALSETNNITILPDGSDTIDGEASLVIASDGASVMLQSNGVDKFIRI